MKKRHLFVLSLALTLGVITTGCKNNEVVTPTDECTVTIDNVVNGTITSDKNSGNVGDKVTLTITPNTGYEIETLTINETSYINDLSGDSLGFLLVKGENKVAGTFIKTADNWNEDTKTLIENIFGEVVTIPYFTGYESYVAKKGIDRVSNQYYIEISGEVKNASTSIADYKTIVDGTNLWNYTTDSSSESLAYFNLKDTTDGVYMYVVSDGAKLSIFAGIDAEFPTDWTSEDKAYMDKYIQKDLYIPYFFIDNSILEPLYLEGFGTSDDIDGVSYTSSTETIDSVVEYADFMKTQEDFILDEELSTDDEFYFSKSLGDDNFFAIDVYLYNNLFCVDGYIYTVESGEAPIDNITADITLLPDNFYISTGSEYGTDGAIFEKDGMNFSTTNIKKGFKTVSAIQCKKSESHFENVNELPALSSITFDQIVENKGYDGTITVKARTSKDSLTEVVGVDGVFTLSDATYFEISNVSSYACYFKTISFDFKNL
jgi:hypothetical protein